MKLIIQLKACCNNKLFVIEDPTVTRENCNKVLNDYHSLLDKGNTLSLRNAGLIIRVDDVAFLQLVD
jgi:hypothetical protein